MIIGDWVVNGLPNDDFSIDNAIILQQSKRWPLMIDPQLQANNWIKKMEKDLKITRLNKQDLTNTISNSMNIGLPVLIENIGETINPELD